MHFVKHCPVKVSQKKTKKRGNKVARSIILAGFLTVQEDRKTKKEKMNTEITPKVWGPFCRDTLLSEETSCWERPSHREKCADFVQFGARRNTMSHRDARTHRRGPFPANRVMWMSDLRSRLITSPGFRTENKEQWLDLNPLAHAALDWRLTKTGTEASAMFQSNLYATSVTRRVCDYRGWDDGHVFLSLGKGQKTCGLQIGTLGLVEFCQGRLKNTRWIQSCDYDVLRIKAFKWGRHEREVYQSRSSLKFHPTFKYWYNILTSHADTIRFRKPPILFHQSATVTLFFWLELWTLEHGAWSGSSPWIRHHPHTFIDTHSHLVGTRSNQMTNSRVFGKCEETWGPGGNPQGHERRQ